MTQIALKRNLSPAHILVLGFLSFILAGMAILKLPLSTTKGISLIDALFTSTSAVCVTGLIVMDTPNDFTLFGQIIILLLIQLGGFGYMTSATILFLMIGKRIGLGERFVMKEALNVISLEGIVRFVQIVLFVSLLVESIGAAILAIRFMSDYTLKRALYYGIFHSVSAFNNAGFSLFSDNLIRYQGDAVVNLVITTLIITGGIGFIVISEIYHFLSKKVLRVSIHSKVVLTTTMMLILIGSLLIFFFEHNNPETLKGMSFKEKVLSSYFSAVTPRTAGFNTIDYSAMKLETLFLTIILMFIGASPGSTGGGIKTTTFAIIIAGLWSTIRGMRDTVMFERRIPLETVSRSFLLATTGFFFVVTVSMVLLVLEEARYISTLFEVTSALGTVGLSLGDGGVRSLSALFTPLGKLFISFMMFAGRLGPLTLAVAIIRKRHERFRYPEGRIVIG